jgi:hypothetical protein
MSGCEIEQGPRELPFPTFDPRQPFPELAQTEGGEGASLSDGAPTSFERAIQDARSGEGDTPPPPEGTISLQAISLASVLVADIPVEFGEWTFASDGVVTIITHRTPGSLPDALIYVEAFSPAMETFPSYEISRFQFTIAPALSAAVIYPPLLGLGWRWIRGELGAPPLDTLTAMQRVTTRTAGWGLGYAPTAGTFTGWKWVGENEHQIRLRIGRSTGSWSTPQPPSAAVGRKVMDELGSRIPELGRIASQIGSAASGLPVRPPSAAWMIHGSATRRNGLGVHVAVLCEQRPVCPVTTDIARMLASLRVPSEGEQLAVGESDVVEFADSAGFSALTREEVISAPRMVALLTRAMAANKEGEGGEAPGVPGLEGLPIPEGARELLPEGARELIPGGGGGGGGGLPSLPEIPEEAREFVPLGGGAGGGGGPLPIPIPTSP